MIPKPNPVDAAVINQPLYAQLMSLAALTDQEKYGGLGDWAVATSQVMEADLRAQHELLFRWIWLDALINAVPNSHKLADLPSYIAALAKQPPIQLRDVLLTHMLNSTHLQLSADHWIVPAPDLTMLLSDTAVFDAHFSEMIRAKFDSSDTLAAHTLFSDPENLQTTLIDHLQTMWDRFLVAAWPQAQRQIERSVAAFAAIPLQNVTMLEAIEQVTGRDLRPAFRLDQLLTYPTVRFVPHVYNGPYIIWFGTGTTLYIGFPAREPRSIPLQLDQTTLVNRCKALADETRLKILLTLAQTDALSTAEIIDRFDLDKSAASRHLRQLVATDLISQARVDKAKKAYRLNRPAFNMLIKNLSSFT